MWRLTRAWSTGDLLVLCVFSSNITGLFEGLDVEAMETAAQGYFKRVNLLGRDIKKWKVCKT